MLPQEFIPLAEQTGYRPDRRLGAARGLRTVATLAPVGHRRPAPGDQFFRCTGRAAWQLEFLRENQCAECQGFLFSRPVNVGDATRLLESHRPALGGHSLN